MAITVQDPNLNKQVQPTNPSGLPSVQKQGSGFTNIQKVVQANKGNQLGQAVGGGVQQVGQQAKQAIGQSQQDFSQAAAASNPYLNNTDQTKSQIQQTVADPVNASNSQVDQFSQYRSGQYGGPQSLNNYADLQQQAQSAQQLGQNLGSTGGRVALLQRFAANPTQTYTAGQSRLDAALLGQQPQGQLQQAQRETRNLTTEADTANQAASAQAQEYQAKAKALADYTDQQVQGAENPTLDKLTKQASDATTDVQNTLADFKAGKASDQELKNAGLGDLIGKSSLGLDLSGYIGATNPNAASRLGVADQNQAATLNALARLGGQTDLANEFTESDANKAGNYYRNQFNGADKALAAYNQANQDYSNLNNSNNSLVSNVMKNSDQAGIISNLLGPELVEKYIKGTPEEQKAIRETQLSDSAFNNYNGVHINNGGQIRDQIAAELNKAAQQYQSNTQALQRYAGGYTYGGPGTVGTVSTPLNPSAQQ